MVFHSRDGREGRELEGRKGKEGGEYERKERAGGVSRKRKRERAERGRGLERAGESRRIEVASEHGTGTNAEEDRKRKDRPDKHKREEGFSNQACRNMSQRCKLCTLTPLPSIRKNYQNILRALETLSEIALKMLSAQILLPPTLVLIRVSTSDLRQPTAHHFNGFIAFQDKTVLEQHAE